MMCRYAEDMHHSIEHKVELARPSVESLDMNSLCLMSTPFILWNKGSIIEVSSD